MKHRFPRLLLALLLCAALLTPTFALAEEIDMEPIEECAHAHTRLVVDPEPIGWTYEGVENPATQHMVRYENYQRTYCDDCGEFLSAGHPLEETYELEDHCWNEGVCLDCGYKCLHPTTLPDSDLENRKVENVNDAYDHRVTGTKYDYTYCTVCDMRFNVTESAYDAMEEHYYEGGSVCDECGFTCVHPETYVDYSYSGKEYVNVGSNSKHRVAGTKTVRIKCNECYAVLSETTADASYFEYHGFNDKGICEKCQYACPHEEVRIETESYDEYTYKDTGDNKTHIRVAKARQYAYCEACGCRVGEPVEVILENVKNHDYYNGVCDDCGHVNTCAHPNKVVRREEAWDSRKDEKTDDPEFHNTTYTYNCQYYCPDCDMWLEQAPGQETETVAKLHHFDRKGVCYDCGYVKNCTHPNAYDRIEGWYGKTTYEDTGSNAIHLCVSDGTTRKFCPDCLKWLGSEQPVSVKNEESHDYNAQGVCVLCGHKNVCEHKRVTKYDSFKWNKGYTAVDANTHNRNGIKQTVLYCDDCGTTIEVLATVEAFEAEPHDFDSYNVCYDCGYKSECTHPNVIKNFAGDFEDWDECKPIDAKSHRVSGWYYTRDVCQDCGRTVWYSDATYKNVLETHHFDENGVCYDCGYKRAECAHANLGGWTLVSNGRATFKNIGHKLVHEATPVLSRRVYCNDCGKLIEDETIASGETMLLYHNFDNNNVCKDCGYVDDGTACAHATTVTNIYFKGSETSFDTGSDATHETHGKRMVTEVYCKDCGRTISETTKSVGIATLPHNYENGICTQCGHVNKCAHANTETKTYIAGKVKDTGNNATHLESGYKFETVTCKDCGVTVSTKLVSKDASENIAHKYVDNMCVVCGHVKTEEPAVEPAAEDDEDDAEEETTTEAPKDIDYKLVSDNTVVNGVKAADKLPVAEALKTIGEALDKEIEADDVTVEIIGADEMMNKVLGDDKAKFDKLPMKDRMLVVLAALGLGDSVGEEAQEGMSDEAKALTAQIAENLDKMDDDAKQELLKTIADLFPKTTVKIDGKDFEAFIIKVVVTRNGEKEYDRYTFYNDGTQWTLYSIERGTPVEATAA